VPSDISDCSNSTACTKMVQVGSQTLSLRAAVEALPAEGGTLELPAGYFTGSGSCGLVVRQSNVTIRGAAGPLETVIDCAMRDRHFVLLGANISIERLRLINGEAAPRSCATAAAMGLNCSLDINGGCLLFAGGPAAVRDCRLEGCTAAGVGGGVAAYGPLTMVRLQVEGCSATRGGGLYSRGGIMAVNSSLNGNSAWQGGAIFVDGAAGVLTGQGLVLAGNTAQNSGGGLHAEGSARIQLGEGSRVQGNTAGANGGGIFLYLWAELVLEGDAAVAENLVTDDSNEYGGGGVCGDEDTRVELRDRAAVVDNVAFKSAGGGLRLTRGSALVVRDDAAIGRNKGTWGGGLYFAQKGTVNVSGRAAVYENTARWSGGGVHLSAMSFVNFPLSGQGAIFLYISGSVSFRSNSATYSGGAISASGRSPEWMRSHVFLTDDVVMESNRGNNGGAINVEHMSSLIVNGRVRFVGNVARVTAGAILVTDQATVHLGGQTVLEKNAASFAAGAIGLEGSELFVRDSVAFLGNSGSYFGGAIAAMSLSVIDLAGAVRVEGNCAGSGGAVFVTQGCALTVAGGTRIVKNQAATGGGINARASTVVVMNYAVVGWNDAALYGGGILMSAAAMQMKGAYAVEHNRAGKEGAGLYLELHSELRVDGGVIDDNTAGQFLIGDCAAALASAASMSGSDGSSAGGGIFATDDSEVTLESGAALRRNSAGAGGAVLIRYAMCITLFLRDGPSRA
jgi:predicted outer membrane repeat protein